jgi:hypothetical protein
VAGDITYKKQYEDLNKRILAIDINAIEHRDIGWHIYPSGEKQRDDNKTKKEIKKLFKEIGIPELSVTGEVYYCSELKVDYPPRFSSKNDYGEPIFYDGSVKMPYNVQVKLLMTIEKAFPYFASTYENSYSRNNVHVEHRSEYIRIGGDNVNNFFETVGKRKKRRGKLQNPSNRRKMAEKIWEETKITKAREKKYRNPPVVCQNQKCKHWAENKKRRNCMELAGKYIKTCSIRLNPDNKPCEICGRLGDKIIMRNTLGGMLCQYCRSSDSRHIGLVKKLGATPTYQGKPIDSIYQEN